MIDKTTKSVYIDEKYLYTQHSSRGGSLHADGIYPPGSRTPESIRKAAAAGSLIDEKLTGVDNIMGGIFI